MLGPRLGHFLFPELEPRRELRRATGRRPRAKGGPDVCDLPGRAPLSRLPAVRTHVLLRGVRPRRKGRLPHVPPDNTDVPSRLQLSLASSAQRGQSKPIEANREVASTRQRSLAAEQLVRPVCSFALLLPCVSRLVFARRPRSLAAEQLVRPSCPFALFCHACRASVLPFLPRGV